MKTIRLFSRLMVSGILVAMLMVLIPSSALAGAGIEPGDSCEEAFPGEEFSFDPPPLIGDLTVTIDGENNVVASGDLELVGTGCTVTVDGLFLDTMNSSEFSQISGNMLMGTCINDSLDIFGECLEGSDRKLEIIAVGKFKWNDPPDNSKFTAKFIIMPLK